MSCPSRLASGAVAIALAGLVATSAGAQGINPFSRDATSLSASELEMIRGSVRQVLQQYRRGATATWSSPETRRAGESTLIDIFQRGTWRCAQVTHRFTAGTGGTYTAPMCETGPGDWKIAF